MVFVNGQRVWMAKHRVTPGDQIEIHGQAPAPSRNWQTLTIPILLDAGDIFVVNKPAGLLSNGPCSVEAQMQAHMHNSQVRAVHRLDKGTSGCLCMARDQAAFKRMVQQFRDNRVTKIYQALVNGTPKQKGTCSAPLDGRRAITHWHVLEQTRIAALLEVRIETGRTHQIRRHLARLGHPILGDAHYHTSPIEDHRIQRIPRPMLHAAVFAAPLGVDDTVAQISAPLPVDFRKILISLNFCFDPNSIRT